ncbi:hypothetical protein MBRA1_003822 [Malassezia brasiliensis]|uniref:Uncharacterized protein n=1 Tax=Malassezia brasiliensis TaxID=1821822 RepID=A0AAF0IRK4_9BASI|nr:hypothetical protein MBRA1_003822 [Malassezia brasiliensis]
MSDTHQQQPSAEPNQSSFGLTSEDPSVGPEQQAQDVQTLAQEPAQELGGTLPLSNSSGRGTPPPMSSAQESTVTGPTETYVTDPSSRSENNLPHSVAPSQGTDTTQASATTLYPKVSEAEEVKDEEQLAQQEARHSVQSSSDANHNASQPAPPRSEAPSASQAQASSTAARSASAPPTRRSHPSHAHVAARAYGLASEGFDVDQDQDERDMNEIMSKPVQELGDTLPTSEWLSRGNFDRDELSGRSGASSPFAPETMTREMRAKSYPMVSEAQEVEGYEALARKVHASRK